MSAKKNKSYTAEFKAKVALDAIKGDLTGCLGAHNRFWDFQVSQNRIASLGGLFFLGGTAPSPAGYDENYVFFSATCLLYASTAR